MVRKSKRRKVVFKFERPQTIGIFSSSGLLDTSFLGQVESNDQRLYRNLVSIS